MEGDYRWREITGGGRLSVRGKLTVGGDYQLREITSCKSWALWVSTAHVYTPALVVATCNTMLQQSVNQLTKICYLKIEDMWG